MPPGPADESVSKRAHLSTTQDYSRSFYSRHAKRYAQITHDFVQSHYVAETNPAPTDDLDLMTRLKELVAPGAVGLDAGCGAGARDVYYYWRDGYDILGIDAVEENVAVARTLHPEIADRISVADLTRPLDFPDESFEFVLCNAVIQHIAPDKVMEVTLPELVRVLKIGGLLQLMFKTGEGIVTVYDVDYQANRTFQLYDQDVLLRRLAALGTCVVPAEGDALGGVMLFQDTKPMRHCVFYSRKKNR